MTEVERIATRALAKRLVSELSGMPWYRSGNQKECAERTAEAIKRAARDTGLPAVWLKSFMLRIQRGEV